MDEITRKTNDVIRAFARNLLMKKGKVDDALNLESDFLTSPKPMLGSLHDYVRMGLSRVLAHFMTLFF